MEKKKLLMWLGIIAASCAFSLAMIFLGIEGTARATALTFWLVAMVAVYAGVTLSEGRKTVKKIQEANLLFTEKHDADAYIAALVATGAVADVSAGTVVVVRAIAHVCATVVARLATFVERTAHGIAARLRVAAIARTGIVDAAAATIHLRPVAHFAAFVVVTDTVVAAYGGATFATAVVATAHGCCLTPAAILRHRSRTAVATVASATLCHCIACCEHHAPHEQCAYC